VTWLTPGGRLAALLVGAAVWWGLGWTGLVPLFAFLLTGSVLTRAATGAGAARNARQVLANGGVAACAALWGRWPEAAGALAAAAADTWATEIGSFSPRAPRLVTTWRRVAPGRSGGITALGTAGGLLGAIAIATCAGLVAPALRWRGAAIAATAGVCGMLADSVLGASLQAQYACTACDTAAERPGSCHGPLRLVRGLRWLDNDGVNLIGSLIGALIAAAAVRWWAGG
jgi:uncharacterized protein (TIGR00297 family)